MTDGNGSPATRAELGAHIKGIDEHFDVIEDDIREIKGLIEGIYQTARAERRDRQAKRLAWGPALTAALIAGGISLPAYFFH